MTKNDTVPYLISRLQAFRDQELEVRISADGGQSSRPISIVGHHMGCCLLEFCGLEDEDCNFEWIHRGKTISHLLEELQTYVNYYPDHIVEISVDDGDNCYPISRIEQSGEYCLLIFDK